MTDKKVLLALLCLNLLFLQYGFGQSTKFFSFTLGDSANTSAGVFKSDSTLIRTLWSGVRYSVGIHIEKWDGLLDDSTPAPSDNYHVKILSNNVTYTWQGAAIGNTSDSLSGQSKIKVGYYPQDLSISQNTLFYGSEYMEKEFSQHKISLSDIGADTVVISGGPDYGSGQVTVYVCSDSVRTYWGGYYVDGQSFVFATNISDNSEVTFPSGVTVSAVTAKSYSALAVVKNNYIRGIAVQKKHNYIFVSRTDSLFVNNKITGASVQKLRIVGAGRLAIDTADRLWLTHGSIIEKYTVNTDGTLTTTGITITGVGNVGAIAVSPNNTKVAICDDSLSQQVVKFYNANTGAYISTLGTPGGYMTNATVNNNKFYFRDNLPRQYPYTTAFQGGIAYQSDSSFWVIDGNNCRIQHYASNNSFINRIQYIPYHYVTQVDANDSTRVFDGYREYQVNYTSPIQQSWTLKNNWQAGISKPGINNFLGMTNPVTLSNGRTYVMQSGDSNPALDVGIFELITGGVARYTGINLTQLHGINKDGSLTLNTWADHEDIRQYGLTGFDGSNNPQWSSAYTTLAAFPPSTAAGDFGPRRYSKIQNAITKNATVVWFNPDRTDATTSFGSNIVGKEFHLGGQKVGSNKWLWKTSIGTDPQYSGDYPNDGSFDNGNGVIYAGGFYVVKDENIIWSYHGEFWKGKQNNRFDHYWQNGLLVSVFGVDLEEVQRSLGYPGAAGNAATGALVKVGNDLYLYHSDESVHSGLTRWKISGLNTVKIQTCEFQNLTIPAKDYMDLTGNLVKGHDLLSYPGWSASNSFDADWGTYLGGGTSNKFLPADIYLGSNLSPTSERYVDKSLGINNGASSWKISGDIKYQYSENPTNTNGQFVEVLDNTDKVIARFYPNNPSSIFNFLGNNVILSSGSSDFWNVKKYRFRNFSISATTGGVLTFMYDGASNVTSQLINPAANWQNPTKLRLRISTLTGGRTYRSLSVRNLKFFVKNTNLTYRTKTNGNWNDIKVWQSSVDSISWSDAVSVPSSSDNSITIQRNHNITVTGSVNVDQLYIKDSGILKIAPNAALIVNDGVGEDVNITPMGSMVIQSDSTGTGRIGTSVGTISGNVTVERFIRSSTNRTYRLLSPSVNTLNGTKPYIRDNWQEGQNNTNIKTNSNLVLRYGIQITGSTTGAKGFDITSKGAPSLFTYNPANTDPSWIQAGNTNATNLEAKKGYLVIIYGDRNTDLRTSNPSSSTTLRATGTVATGTQVFTKPAGDRGTILVGNPYPSSIDWKTIYNDNSTSNSTNLENYYTYWDAQVGTSGGYVTVNSDGIKSAPTNATTEIQSGQAFLIRPKKGVVAPTLMVKESHKSSNNNLNVFRVKQPQEFMTSLYYSKEGRRIMADAVNAVFDNTFSGNVDDNDAEEIENAEENMAIKRDGKMLSIEERPIVNNSDTLPLILQRLKPQNYELQFNPSAFTNPNIYGFLNDQFLHTLTAISLNEITTVKFSVTGNDASASQNRFNIVFTSANEIADRTRTADVTNNQDGGIRISPNPVTSNYSTVQFNHLPKGTYLMSLTDNLGQLILTKTIIHPGGSANHNIPIDANLHSGIYTLLITGNGKSFNKKLIK